MIERVYYYVSDNINPYHNQALQNYFLNNIPDDSMIFMMWQNNDVALLANNQSVYKEINLVELENDRCYLARRETIGKCLYNDLGTLNYAFFMYQNNYNIVSQINVLYQALRKLNLPVYLNNNNEIMLDGKRITDNSYIVHDEKCMHAGSLHWDTDKSKRIKILKDSAAKKDLGNIVDYNPCINLLDIKKKVLQSLADLMGVCYQWSLTEDLLEKVNYYRDNNYLYQPEKKYTIIINEQYDFGQTQIYFDMLKNKILHVDIYLADDNYEVIDNLKNVFDDMIVDDYIYRNRVNNLDDKYLDDFNSIYSKIKKESYHL